MGNRAGVEQFAQQWPANFVQHLQRQAVQLKVECLPGHRLEATRWIKQQCFKVGHRLIGRTDLIGNRLIRLPGFLAGKA